MTAYYYLMSSLPMLKYDEAPPFGYDAFLEMCQSNVKASKYKILETLTLENLKEPFVSGWSEFYLTLQNELAFQRSERLNKPVKMVFQRDGEISKIISDVLNEKNPLKAEKMLLAAEFEKLDELIGLHQFDDHALMGYALKLKLLERKNIFRQANGKKELNRIIDGLERQIMHFEE